MASFIIRFFLCNIFISIMIIILLTAKRIFRNSLSSRMQYNLWFLLLGLLAVPFIPFQPIRFSQMFAWLERLKTPLTSNTGTIMDETTTTNSVGTANWMKDFTLSVSSNTPSIAGFILCGIWIIGIITMIIFVIKSSLRLRRLKKSALPLQNPEVRRIYNHCLKEMNIKKDIPIYSTAFLKSPIFVGLLKPCIYLPIHLISDYNATDLRYMLLHELQHYRHKDTLGNYLMNIAGVLYWFNPFVWFALQEMRNDREVACDTSVLHMLEGEEYEDYGSTLINLAEKVSRFSFPFAAGISGNMKQMKQRIINITSYKKPTLRKRLQGIIAFSCVTLLLLGLAPALSTYAAEGNNYRWKLPSGKLSSIDLSTYFGKYEGSFVLYDLANDSWRIHDREHAVLRISPNSTYKIYDALFGLEEGVITPEDSLITWNQEIYPFEAWNSDQTLPSAMSSSVNWYFLAIDKQLGKASIRNYIYKTGYGNEDISGGLSTYWMESSLKISPVEQVQLLIKLYHNDFGFSKENINAVKDSLCLSSSKTGTLYGKTGTGRIDGQDVNGWFVGYIETADNTYFFATNIGADKDAAGSSAAEITMSILSGMNIWK